jgi:hypothetical protein
MTNIVKKPYQSLINKTITKLEKEQQKPQYETGLSEKGFIRGPAGKPTRSVYKETNSDNDNKKILTTLYFMLVSHFVKDNKENKSAKKRFMSQYKKLSPEELYKFMENEYTSYTKCETKSRQNKKKKDKKQLKKIRNKNELHKRVVKRREDKMKIKNTSKK